jgi:hypothetical protein
MFIPKSLDENTRKRYEAFAAKARLKKEKMKNVEFEGVCVCVYFQMRSGAYVFIKKYNQLHVDDEGTFMSVSHVINKRGGNR